MLRCHAHGGGNGGRLRQWKLLLMPPTAIFDAVLVLSLLSASLSSPSRRQRRALLSRGRVARPPLSRVGSMAAPTLLMFLVHLGRYKEAVADRPRQQTQCTVEVGGRFAGRRRWKTMKTRRLGNTGSSCRSEGTSRDVSARMNEDSKAWYTSLVKPGDLHVCSSHKSSVRSTRPAGVRPSFPSLRKDTAR